MRFAGSTALVTGGAGFIGSNLVTALLKEGAKVRVVDNFFSGSAENLEEVRGKIELIEGSVSSREIMREALKGVDYVFHLATVNIIAAVSFPLLEEETNVRGTVNLLELCKDLHIKRFLYTSSVSVYGFAQRFPISEDTPPSFTSIYPAGKYAGEAYSLAFHKLFGVPITILRYSNVYGPKQSPQNPYSGVISKFFLWAIKGEPLRIYGNGKQTRDFVYVDDVVEATLRAALLPSVVGEVFNIATGKETSINQLAEKIVSLVNPYAELKVEYLPNREIDSIPRRVLNIEKARNILGWQPLVDLEEGLRKTYEWFKTQTLEDLNFG